MLECNQVYHMDALSLLGQLDDGSVNCIVTSPPYYGLRDYGVEGQIGLEPTPREFIDKLTAIFREARRVLRDDGTLWVNMGDSYVGGGGYWPDAHSNQWSKSGKRGENTYGKGMGIKPTKTLVEKNLLGIPWRLAFALQDDGWILRSDIIWNKTSCMPESVTDRPTKSHEYVFLLVKSPRYFYDKDAIAEPIKTESSLRAMRGVSDHHKNLHIPGQSQHSMHKARANGEGYSISDMRNKRTVWTVGPEPSSFAHFATFPTELIKPMILAGCPDKTCLRCGAPWIRVVEISGGTIGKGWTDHSADLTVGMNQAGGGLGERKSDNGQPYTRIDKGFEPTCTCNAATRPGLVLDPFMGSGTTGLVARANGRDYIGSELNAEYVAIARERLRLPYEQHYITPDNDLSHLPLFALLPESDD